MTWLLLVLALGSVAVAVRAALDWECDVSMFTWHAGG